MKHLVTVIASLFLFTLAQAASAEPGQRRAPLLKLHQGVASVTASSATGAPRAAFRANVDRSAGSARTAALAHMAATPVIAPTSCVEPAAICGFVTVPLDRHNPAGPKLQIYFEQYVHSNPGPAESAIFMNFGGPGPSTSDSRYGALYLFGNNLDAHDLVLVDDRGRGLSGAIDCDALQHGTAPLDKAESACAAQLGTAASRYGTGDIARDLEDVRAALGYDQIDYFGASYGGMDLTAYATRFGSHLRSVVLDAPLGEPGLDNFARLRYRTFADLRMVKLNCLRSAQCSRDNRDPAGNLLWLIDAIRARPVEGDAFDANGNSMHVRVDESALLNFVVHYPSGFFTNVGEVPAAAAALQRGDAVPLLRLAAEGFFTADPGESGDPTDNSAGAYYATGCIDPVQPWDWNDSVAGRKRSYDAAARHLPANYFYPFSRSAATGPLFSNLGYGCLWWQRPTLSAAVVPNQLHAVYPDVPTLVLVGDIDNRVPLEEVTAVASRFPHSHLVKIPAAGHYTIDYSQCAIDLASNFIETLDVGDTSCANQPALIWPAVGRFPRTADAARAADPQAGGGNQADEAARKVASVAVATAIDAIQRSAIGYGSGVGLRGGSFQTDYGNDGTWTTTLANARFANDVQVSGTVIWAGDYSVAADLVVTGPGKNSGTLHIAGAFLAGAVADNFVVTGVLGNRKVAVVVPET